MKRMRTAAIIFCILLLIVFFNYIYVLSVRLEMLQHINQMCENTEEISAPDTLEQTWKNRKGLLSLSVPLAVLDQIDIQLSVAKACTITEDRSGYLRACHHLRELVNSLRG
ncbi:MAG: DUF4363 family protein [Clostridia bacterium]|nr:DUF4363 family protein [Clostridia bacterium]